MGWGREGAPGIDFASGPGSGPVACGCAVCASGHPSSVQCLWSPEPPSDVDSLSCVLKTCLCFPSQIEPGLPLPLPLSPPPLPSRPGFGCGCVHLEGPPREQGNIEGRGEWICVRWSPNNAGDSQASAGLQCWPGFKSLLLANWDREGASCDWATDGFKGAAGAGLSCPGDLVPLGPLEQSIRADGAPEH